MPAEPDRGDRVVGVVGVDHQRDIRPDRLAHRARHRGVLLDAEADLQLHRLEALRDVAGRLLGEIARADRPICAGKARSRRPAPRVRSGPPSSWCTGTPKCLPLMSQSAMSMPLSPWITTPFWP